MKALGMVETYGVIGAIEAADVMLKVADVSLIKKERVQGGLQLITVEGDVGAVKVAVDAAASAVNRLGESLLFGAHVIPRPDNQLRRIYSKEDSIDENASSPNPDAKPMLQPEFAELAEVVKLETPEEIAVKNDNTDEVVYKSETEFKTVLNKKRAADLKEMVIKNENIFLSEDEILKMFKKDLINLLISDFRKQNERKNQKEEK